MQYNVASLLQEHSGATRTYAIDDDVIIDGERRHVTGRARFDGTPRGVFARVQVSGEWHCECSRCLRSLTLDIIVNFEEEYVPTVDIGTGARVALLEGEEDAYRISARHILDLSEAIRQYWALAVPIAPVCSEDCAGLCPECGVDMNSARHDCAPASIDPRWSVLQKLKQA